ncbi:MAG: RDD family protein, partial [Candidatus Acidiferrum sp.]
YCSKCGNLVADGVAFCPACGQPALSTASAPVNVGIPADANPMAALPAGNYPPVAPQVAAPVGYGQPAVQFAGFWLRVAAYLIDGVVMGLAFTALFIPFAMMTGLTAALGSIHPGGDPKDMGALLSGTIILGVLSIISLAIVGGWLYHAKMESSSWQATLGKKALNLRVTDMAGARVTFGRASGRHFAKLITGLIPLGVGFAMAGFTERRQTLHDMLAGCLVLRDG